MNQDVIAALQKHDRTILSDARKFSAQLPIEIENNLSKLDEEARELAVELVRLHDGENTGSFMLKMTGDNDLNVASLAIDSLSKIINKPKAEEIIGVIPKREDPFIRGKLFLEAGNSKERDVLPGLRSVFANETDEEVKQTGLAALTKLGGQPEKVRFSEIIAKASPDDAIEIQQLILYIGKAEVGKGMVSWLANEEDVTRISTDENVVMARMCDIAIWTAHLLGIKLSFAPTHLTNFSKEQIEEASKTLQLLPD